MNLIVVGDSFCASADAWPQSLANQLNLKLICHGQGGQPWWNARGYMGTISAEQIESTEYIVFVHTNADRIATVNEEIGLINHSALPTREIETAVQLYFKYIHSTDFLHWAQESWFLEINRRWGHKKICHLHSFPWSLRNGEVLDGLNITTNLCSISLNELGSKNMELFNDSRSNHLSAYNNNVLADQLANLLKKYKKQKVSLNTDLFELKTTKWFDWN